MKISAYMIVKGIRYFKNYGLKEFFIRLREKSESEEISYKEWRDRHCVKAAELEKQRLNSLQWKEKPLISVIIIADDSMIQEVEQTKASLNKQSYQKYEVFVDNGIDLPSIIDNANGEFVAFIEAGDFISPDALFEIGKAIVYPENVKQSGVHWENNDMDVDIIYSDEDSVASEDNNFCKPYFKPDFNIDLLRNHNYIEHIIAVRTTVARQIKCSWGYDFVLQSVETSKKIIHIPKVLYHAFDKEKFDDESSALEAHLTRCGLKGKIKLDGECVGRQRYRIFYDREWIEKVQPLVSIIIPNKDEKLALKKCLDSIQESSYTNLEVIIVENNSVTESIKEFYEQIDDLYNIPIKIVKWSSDGGFNYSAINNYGGRYANGQYYVLLNNDVEIITRDWIEELLSICVREDVAIVGTRLYYPDDTIQHAGIVVGIGGHVRGIAANMLVGLERRENGYMCKANTISDFSSVTAAFMMIKAEVFNQVGGLTEQLSVAFNDVDLCLKARKVGYLVVYDPFVEAYHYESKSRGQEDTKEKVRRFQSEIEYMRTEWNDIMRYGDPYYNPNFTSIRTDYSINGMS